MRTMNAQRVMIRLNVSKYNDNRIRVKVSDAKSDNDLVVAVIPYDLGMEDGKTSYIKIGGNKRKGFASDIVDEFCQSVLDYCHNNSASNIVDLVLRGNGIVPLYDLELEEEICYRIAEVSENYL